VVGVECVYCWDEFYVVVGGVCFVVGCLDVGSVSIYVIMMFLVMF